MCLLLPSGVKMSLVFRDDYFMNLFHRLLSSLDAIPCSRNLMASFYTLALVVSVFVETDNVDSSLRGLSSNLNLDWNSLSKWISLLVSEGKVDLIDFSSGNHVVRDSQWNLDLLLVLSLHLSCDGDVEDLNWEISLSLLIADGDVTS